MSMIKGLINIDLEFEKNPFFNMVIIFIIITILIIIMFFKFLSLIGFFINLII